MEETRLLQVGDRLQECLASASSDSTDTLPWRLPPMLLAVILDIGPGGT